MKTQSKIIVRYAETDQMGIAHHSVYPVWYEVARSDYIKQIGMTYSEMEKEGVMTPVVELTSKYRLPACYEDELTIEVCIGRLSPARIEFLYMIYKNGEERPINTGSTMHAWVGKDMAPFNLKKHRPDLYAKIEHCKEN